MVAGAWAYSFADHVLLPCGDRRWKKLCQLQDGQLIRCLVLASVLVPPPTPKFNVDAALLIGQLAKFLPRRHPPPSTKTKSTLNLGVGGRGCQSRGFRRALWQLAKFLPSTVVWMHLISRKGPMGPPIPNNK